MYLFDKNKVHVFFFCKNYVQFFFNRVQCVSYSTLVEETKLHSRDAAKVIGLESHSRLSRLLTSLLTAAFTKEKKKTRTRKTLEYATVAKVLEMITT